MQSKTPFDYFISVTGDCSNSSSGVASILLSGGNAPYTVEWVEPDLGADVIELEPSIRSGLSNGTYGVRVNDSTLPYNQEFYINIPISGGICVEIDLVSPTSCNSDNGSVTGSSSSDYSSTNFYLYTSNDEYINSGSTNLSQIVFSNLSGGTYYILGEDIGGCTGKSSNFIVETSTELDYGLYVLPNSSCGGTPIGKIYVTGQTGNGPYTYLWNNGHTGNTISGLTSGVYSVQVTDNLGCSLTKSATIVDIDPIGFGQFTSTPPSCLSNDGIINLTITGGSAPYYYSASTGNVEISYGQSFTLSGLSAGQYNFSVTDAGLCSINVGTTLFAPEGVTSVEIVGQNSFCSSNGGSISVSVTDGQSPYTYSIINPTGGTDSLTSILNNYTFDGLSEGLYVVTFEDSNGCGKTENITITTESSFDVVTKITGTTCNSDNGIIKVEKTSGGTLPFTYILDDSVNFTDTSASAVTFNNVSTGSHNIKVIDATGCTQTFQVFVPSSSSLNFSLYKTSCGLGDDGTIIAFISSGEPPFTFNWSDNVIGNPQNIEISGLTAGTYSLTIVDDNGCSLTRSTNISCDSAYTSFQTYLMGGEGFQIQTGGKLGIRQMYNEGFFDLTSDNTSCDLNNSSFIAKVSVNPLGIDYENTFYISNSLIDYPGDNLWYNTIKDLLLNVNGIENVIINPITNQIKIETDKSDNFLDGQEISVELIILYEITCTS